MTIGLVAGGSSDDADYWVLCDTPFDWYYYNLWLGWQPGILVTHQGPLSDFGSFEVMNFPLPVGLYNCYFGVDTNINGIVGVIQPRCSYQAASKASVRWFQKSSHQSSALNTRKANIGSIESACQLAPGIFNRF